MAKNTRIENGTAKHPNSGKGVKSNERPEAMNEEMQEEKKEVKTEEKEIKTEEKEIKTEEKEIKAEKKKAKTEEKEIKAEKQEVKKEVQQNAAKKEAKTVNKEEKKEGKREVKKGVKKDTDRTGIKKDIKGTGKFGLGHKKTRRSPVIYVLEDIKEGLIKAKNWCVVNYRTSIPAAICLALVVIVVVCLIRNARISRQEEQTIADDTAVVTEAGGIPIPDEPLQENAYDYINQFVAKYYTACAEGDLETYMSMRSYTDETEQVRMQKKANYIEYFQNLICYTKPGPIENSYLVYVYYEVKFNEIDTVAPGLNTLYVCTNDEGELYVFSGDADENISEYMQIVSTQEDVKDLFNKVQVTYNDAVDSDEELKAFLEELAVNLKMDVGVEIALLEAENAANETDDADTQTEATESQDLADGSADDAEAASTGEEENEAESTQEQEPVTETVRTTDTVNIRSSASAEATKLGSASPGTRFTRLEVMENGWSRIDYNGSDGYIKTEYLEVVESAVGTVTVLQNVNIRSEASETASKLGIAYEGSTLELIETQDDGWSRIIYEGQTAYVKSEYVQ